MEIKIHVILRLRLAGLSRIEMGIEKNVSFETVDGTLTFVARTLFRLFSPTVVDNQKILSLVGRLLRFRMDST